MIPENNASRLVTTNDVEYAAPAAAKAPSNPATGWRPAALNTIAASGGMTIITESAITCPTMQTAATA